MTASETMMTRMLEIRRSRRLKGQATPLGDARQGFQALMMAALAEGPSKLENLPDSPWFREALQAFVRMGYVQQALDGHWLVHGGSRPVEGAEPLRVRHEADLLALAGFLSGQGVRRTLEVDLDGVSAEALDLLGKILKLETPGDFSPAADAPAAPMPEAAPQSAAPAPAPEAAPEPEPAPEPDAYDMLAAELNAALGEETGGGTSSSAEALRADTGEGPEASGTARRNRGSARSRRAGPEAREAAEGPAAGELESGALPEDEGRFLRIIPGGLQKKAADLLAGTLPGRPGAGPARLADLGWDEYLAKLVLLPWHVAAGKALDLSLLRAGPELPETVAAQFGAPLRTDRNQEEEGDELARRIARQLRAAGKQDPMTRLRLSPPVKLKAQGYTVPADVSETAALCLAATLLKGSDITLDGAVLGPSRAGFLGALRRMGADIEVVTRRERQGETLGALRVRSTDLLGKRFGAEHLVSMRDEIFLLMVAAAFAEGETILRDIGHLRRHRRDLLKAFAAALKAAGVEIGAIEDGLVIRGRPDYDGAAYDALGHPALALACLVMGLKSHGSSTLAGADCLEARHPGLMARFAALAAADAKDGKAGKAGKPAGAGAEADASADPDTDGDAGADEDGE